MRLKQPPQKKICYVIMPFSSHAGISAGKWTEIYEDFFKLVIESTDFGYECIRSEITPGAFTKEIVENMKNAYLVLADITGFNGNVMWELGVRHALSTRTIIVADKDTKAQKFISDLSIYGVVEYSTKGPKPIKLFNEQIKKILKKIEDNPEKPDNPVFDFLKIEDLVMKSYQDLQIRNKLTGLLSELIENVRVIDNHTSGKFKITKKFVGYYRFNSSAIQELLITNYIYRSNFNTIMTSLKTWVDGLNRQIDGLSEMLTNEFSEKDREKAVKQIYKSGIEVKNRCEVTIKTINQILKDENEHISDSIPNPIIFDEKYKKLLD